MKKLLSSLLFLLPMSWAHAADSTEAALKEKLQKFDPTFIVRDTKKSPINGVFEIVFEDKNGNKQIAYSDGDGKYLILGQMIDVASQRNLTQLNLRKLDSIPFRDIPLREAIRWVQGAGTRTLVVLSDPMCPYCKKLEQDIEQLQDVTVYLLPMPVEYLHPGATNLSLALWCADDPAKAWRDYMLRNVSPSPAKKSCRRSFDKVADLTTKYNLAGTPNLIFKDGAVVRGALPRQKIELWLKDTPQ